MCAEESTTHRSSRSSARVSRIDAGLWFPREARTVEGTYTLLVELDRDATVEVGALGERALDRGWYAYTGSAFGPGGFARVERHRELAAGERDARHWHVDYLLGHPGATLREVVRSGGADVECAAARRLPDGPVEGFGASDCDCPSHLAPLDGGRRRALAAVEAAHAEARPGTSGFAIRRYAPDDAGAVWRVHERALRASGIEFVEDAPGDADLRRVEESYREGAFLVGTADGDAVATGGFRPRPDDPRTAEIRRMRVDPDHRRRGVAAAMLAALERRAHERGFERAWLETNADLTAARGLYESMGYRRTGERTVDDPDGSIRLLHYARDR
jgi:endonuclease-3